ncbi:MAG: CocE/NonD family hydrolase [Dehalococcoidales bacterium]|nr:CocE/NonD family hydrolase [Dehalococcoidales bacterium]
MAEVSSIRVYRGIPMKMRDGVVLYADVYRPVDQGKHPAIVARTPYNKTQSGDSDYLSAVRAAFAGYAYVIQDTRGRFASEGEWKFGMPEGEDGYDTVEAVAAEPWCDGNVGLTGVSYLGGNLWQAAAENPPHLKAVAPSITVWGPLREPRMSGAVDFEQALSWFVLMATEIVERMKRQGKDVARTQAMLEQARFNLSEVYSYLPVKDIPHFQAEGLSQGFRSRVTEALPPEVKTEQDLFWPYHKVTVPCFHAGSWYDIYLGSLFTNFLGMREQGGSVIARQGQYLLCGPWAHSASLDAYVGGLHFGPAGSGVAASVIDRHLKFFNKYLRGIGADPPNPPVHYFVMGLNRWRDAETWPLPETEWQRFFLHSRGRANTLAGEGLLDRNSPGPESPDVFVYDPRFPVPTLGGRVLASGTLVPGPFDQTPVEKRSDVLCYTTPWLENDLEVTGPLKLHLFAATSARDTDFVAKLVDVYPDGAAYNVTEGVIRARYRQSPLQPVPVNSGQVYEYVIDLAHTSVVFRRGHRIRIDITSSNFPKIDRNLNTGHPFGEDVAGVPAVQTVHHEVSYPSYIDLPVIPATKAIKG